MVLFHPPAGGFAGLSMELIWIQVAAEGRIQSQLVTFFLGENESSLQAKCIRPCSVGNSFRGYMRREMLEEVCFCKEENQAKTGKVHTRRVRV